MVIPWFGKSLVGAGFTRPLHLFPMASQLVNNLIFAHNHVR